MTSQSRQLLNLALMLLARRFDERFEALRLTGGVSKWYSGVGNEATTVAAGLGLEPGDVLATLHRDLGAILAVYLDPARAFPGFGFGEPDRRRPDPVSILERLAAQLLGRRTGFSQGIERSFHYSYLAPGEGIFHVGMVSHLGAMIPVAAGCAFALKHQGTDRVALNFIGDGGTSTGDFHEGLNMAAVWKLPLVLVVENNQYAFSTPVRQQFATERLSDRGRGYGIAAATVDGNDPEAVGQVLDEAIERGRAGAGPTLIEAVLGRMRGHSEGDDSLKVVPERDLRAYRAADPLATFERRLRRLGIVDQGAMKLLEQRVDFLVESSVQSALAADAPDPGTALRGVFAPAAALEAQPSSVPAAGETVTYVEAIHRALAEEMERDPQLVLMGQDIGRFEGAFRVTRGLYDRWPRRVLDTPMAESGTVGIAVGAALLGYRVVIEMQFADFVSCGFNQLVNLAAKLYYRWLEPCPIVVRLPSGGGVGAGPFHSQNPEGWFCHTAGLKVVCPATAGDAFGLLKAAIRDPNPVIFCEHKYLYRRVKDAVVPGGPPLALGEAKVRRHGRDVTLIAYGASLWTCLEAAEELAGDGVEAEVVDLRTLVPFDGETVAASVRRTGRAVVVHEAQTTAGFGAEVAAFLADECFAWLDAPVARVGYPDRPVPYARALEAHLSPDRPKVAAAVRRVLEF